MTIFCWSRSGSGSNIVGPPTPRLTGVAPAVKAAARARAVVSLLLVEARGMGVTRARTNPFAAISAVSLAERAKLPKVREAKAKEVLVPVVPPPSDSKQ